VQQILLRPNNYFEIAEEYTALQGIFLKDRWLSGMSLWLEMVISPIISFISFFVYNQTPTIFGMLGFHKAITLWTQWIRYKTLTYEIREWTNIVRSIGGPFISSNDPTFHVFVYADGMQRIWNSLFILSEERAKCS
jgi:hypothetical protein